MKRTRKILFFRLNDFWFDFEGFNNSKSAISILHTDRVLDSKLYSFKISEKTFFIDLTRIEEDIFGGFDKKSARYTINKSQKEGVVVFLAKTNKEIERFHQFFSKFSKIKGIPGIKESELKECDIFYAISIKGDYLGGCAFIKAEDKSVYRYKHGATSYKHNENDLLIWEAIKYAKEQGYKYFDMGGVSITKDKESYYYRHYKFKEKFGGDLIDFYSYIKIRKPLSYFAHLPNFFIFLFFKNDYNSFINFLNKFNLLK